MLHAWQRRVGLPKLPGRAERTLHRRAPPTYGRLRHVNNPIDSRTGSVPTIKLGTLVTYALPGAPVQFFYLLMLLMYLKFASLEDP